jgi:hypothetical protein
MTPTVTGIACHHTSGRARFRPAAIPPPSYEETGHRIRHEGEAMAARFREPAGVAGEGGPVLLVERALGCTVYPCR